MEYGSYEAYCVDEAVTYLGMTVEAELDKAGQESSKEQRKVEYERRRVLDRMLRDSDEVKPSAGFADPASLF